MELLSVFQNDMISWLRSWSLSMLWLLILFLPSDYQALYDRYQEMASKPGVEYIAGGNAWIALESEFSVRT